MQIVVVEAAITPSEMGESFNENRPADNWIHSQKIILWESKRNMIYFLRSKIFVFLDPLFHLFLLSRI